MISFFYYFIRKVSCAKLIQSLTQNLTGTLYAALETSLRTSSWKSWKVQNVRVKFHTKDKMFDMGQKMKTSRMDWVPIWIDVYTDLAME